MTPTTETSETPLKIRLGKATKKAMVANADSQQVYAEFKIHPPKITGWWFQTFFIFTSTWGKNIQFDDNIFARGLKPPPRFT